tara:strand:+ start:3791 stop:4342 length:552 start_codon:yes stop_codon:yes gene_type:complete
MKDNRLLTPKAQAVMMGWEDPIMKDAASLICHNKGRILNVGFGLGLIDTYIQSHNVDEHWIIEAHPNVQNKMKKDGWDKKSNVICLFDKWQNVLDKLPKFDGIYFDTWKELLDPFHEIVPNILKPGGKYTYFSPTDLNVHSVFKSRKYKVQKYITKLDYIADNQNYYDKSNKNFTHRLITKIT